MMQIAQRLSESKHCPGKQGFTLLELLVVMSIIVVLSGLSVPAIRSLNMAGGVNRAASDLSGTLDRARTYAMSNATYVRVALGEVTDSAGKVTTVVTTLYSSDGSDGGDMSQSSDWPALGKSVLIDDMLVFDSLDATVPNTGNDATPAGKNVTGTPIASFDRRLPGVSSGQVTYTAVIQFSPNGSASVAEDEPARYIKIAMDRPKPGNQSEAEARNPFILRVSGINGSINVLRAEAMSL
jgi:prepilin-type N-terminal cleavage/methylation domain-containing protein